MEHPCILVVDDDLDVLEMSDFFFKEAGVEVHCAENGEQALEKIQGNRCAVMLTDFNMPGMNGLELAEKARAIAPSMHIILATGQPSQELSTFAAKSGITTILAKPVQLEELLCLVKEAIPPASS